jgi:transcriptional/translational regulatory protein YebC/TACO1
VNLESLRYEGYGPGGTAILADCLTSHPERTTVALRRAFAGGGGHLGAQGSVSYLFQEFGALRLRDPGDGAVAAVALEAGAEEVVRLADGAIEVLTAPTELAIVAGALHAAGFPVVGSELTTRSSSLVPVSGESAAALARLLETLISLEDVHHVYSNAALPEPFLARLPA